MDFRGNQNNSNNAAPQPPKPQQHAAATPPRFSAGNANLGGSMKSGNKKVWVTVVVVVAVLLLAAAALWGWKTMSAGAGIKTNQYQALFLTNGQVYFGKLANVSDKYVKLTDIYYLQVQQQVQPAEEGQQEQPQVSLAKLGNELHGPEDEMQVNRDQVLFWENLKDNGKVVEAIKQHKQQ